MTTFNDSRCILDVRGLIIRAWSTAEKTIAEEDGKPAFASWQDGIDKFLDGEVFPLLEAGYAPRQIIAVWDAGNSYRKARFAGYKEKREEKSKTSSKLKKDTMFQMFEFAKRLMAHMGVKNLHVPGEEADDVIALLVQQLSDCYLEIRTVDEDLLQLLGPNVTVRKGRKTYFYEHDFDASTEKGTPLRFLRLYKSLVGDSSDEYKGIPQFGPKTFERLLNAYEDDGLRQLEQAIDTNNPSMVVGAYEATQDKDLGMLLEHWKTWQMGWDLAGLHPECCYGAYNGTAKKPTWFCRVPTKQRTLSLLYEIELESKFHRVEPFLPTEILITADTVQESPGDMTAIAEQILASPIVSYDYESSDKNQYENYKEASDKPFVDVLSQQLAGMSINYGANQQTTVYFSFDHKDTNNLPLEWAVWLHQVLDARQGPTVVQNAAFELTVCKRNLNYVPKAPLDTQIMMSYVDENEPSNLKTMSKDQLWYKQLTYKDVVGELRMCDVTAEHVLHYGCDDSLVTSVLFDLFYLTMKLEGTWDFYRTYEVEPAIDDSQTFIDGTPIDLELLREFRAENTKQIEASMEKMHALLAEHCTNKTEAQVMPHAQLLFQEWWKGDHLRYIGKPDQVEKLEELKHKLWNRAWTSCFYRPPVTSISNVPEELVAPSTVAPTPGKITKLAQKFVPDAPALSKATKKAIEEWEMEVSDFIGTNKGEGYELLSELQTKVYSARANFPPAKRNGQAWDDLVDFFLQYADIPVKKKTKQSLSDELNLGSPIQMQGLLYGKLELPVHVRSKVSEGSARHTHNVEGAPATGLKAITAAFVYDLQGELDGWRAQILNSYKTAALAEQNESLYYSKYPLWISPEDGMMHPQRKNCGTVTRRPSGHSPNELQVSGKDDSRIRKLFPANGWDEEDRIYISIDWQSQELLILACESKDPAMLNAFQTSPRLDLHSVTGASIAPGLFPRLGGPIIQTISYVEFVEALHDEKHELHRLVTEVRKKFAKAVNFLIAYGGGYTTLAGNLLIDVDMANAIINDAFSLYYRIQPWQNEVTEFARRYGYAQTPYGNRRHATFQLWSGDKGAESRMGRQLANFTVQGTAADILKVARQEMVKREIVRRFNVKGMKQIYDEITASVPIPLASQYIGEMTEIMQIQPPGYPVRLGVDVEIGRTWGNQIEVTDWSEGGIQQALEKLENK